MSSENQTEDLHEKFVRIQKDMQELEAHVEKKIEKLTKKTKKLGKKTKELKKDHRKQAEKGQEQLEKIEKVKDRFDMKLNVIESMILRSDASKYIVKPRCPVCDVEMSHNTKIAQCISGHHLCWECLEKLNDKKDCPSCSQPVNGRALGMESYLKTLFGKSDGSTACSSAHVQQKVSVAAPAEQKSLNNQSSVPVASKLVDQPTITSNQPQSVKQRQKTKPEPSSKLFQLKDQTFKNEDDTHRVNKNITSKQKVVGIQSLGDNTVTIKDGQLIVQGPDHDAATAIAKQLASGQAKLGNVGGKQVLVILGQEEDATPGPSKK